MKTNKPDFNNLVSMKTGELKRTMKTKEEIATKHGIINGFTIHSNPDIAQRNLYNAMQEYAELYHAQFKEVVRTDKELSGIYKMANKYDFDDFKQIMNLNKEPVTDSPALPSDEEIEKWAHDKSVEALSGSNYTPIVLEMNDLARKAAITGAKALRDGKIK